MKIRDGPAAVSHLRSNRLLPSLLSKTLCFLLDAIARLRASEKAGATVKVVSQKTYQRLDDFVPSWIGAVVAAHLLVLRP